jgi:hypothetical protein
MVSKKIWSPTLQQRNFFSDQPYNNESFLVANHAVIEKSLVAT